MITALLFGISLLQQPAQDPLAGLKFKTYQFVALRKGAPVSMDAATAQKAQKEHLDRLEKMWLTDGKAVLVGPFADDGDIRGIAILDTSADEAKNLFADDPFVKSGAMVAEIRPLMAAEGHLRKPPKFLDLMKYHFGFYRRPAGELPKLEKAEADRLQNAHLMNNLKMAQAGALVWAGPFLDDSPVRGILVFRETDPAKIKALVAEDPLVKAGRLELELHPAFTAKGAFPPADGKSGG